MYECTKEFKTTLFDKNEPKRIKIEIANLTSIYFVALCIAKSVSIQ